MSVFDGKPHQLKLGASFKKNPSSSFNTVRYDYNPPSVDKSQEGMLTINKKDEVTITLSNVAGSGAPCTIYKGNKRPHSKKECVLIIDQKTGEIVLERLSNTIQVKKTREGLAKTKHAPRPLTPIDKVKMPSIDKVKMPSIDKVKMPSIGKNGSKPKKKKAKSTTKDAKDPNSSSNSSSPAETPKKDPERLVEQQPTQPPPPQPAAPSQQHQPAKVKDHKPKHSNLIMLHQDLNLSSSEESDSDS